MKIAIDLDGTIGKRPFDFRALMLALKGRVHIVVLTAAAGELPRGARPAAVAERLWRLGIEEYDELACVESHEKGTWCRDQGVSICIDDDPSVIADVKAKSPMTLCLKVE